LLYEKQLKYVFSLCHFLSVFATFCQFLSLFVTFCQTERKKEREKESKRERERKKQKKERKKEFFVSFCHFLSVLSDKILSVRRHHLVPSRTALNH